MMNKITIGIGIALLVLGFGFILLPHDYHNTVLGFVVHQHVHEEQMAEHGSHDTHISLGAGAGIIGLLLTIYGVKRK